MLDLLDYRRRVFALYERIRESGTNSPEAYTLFKETRDNLFAHHPQSPLDEVQKAAFAGLHYYGYDPDYRIVAGIHPLLDTSPTTIDLGDDGQFTMQQFGEVEIVLPTGSGKLGVYWIMGYGGGVFIPFRDATNGDTTYGGGRYLFDTIKGADLGTTSTHLNLDFNYAYHPSCYYNVRWVCPLAPATNQVDFRIEVGEQSIS